MTERDDKINDFQSSVDREIESEIKTVIEAAAKEKENTLKKGEDEMLEYSFKKISSDAKKIKMECARMVSKRSFEARRDILKTRDGLINDFFGGIQNKLTAFTAGEQYSACLMELVDGIEKEMPFDSDTVIYLKKGEKSDGIRRKYPMLVIEESDKIKIGGAAFYYPGAQKYIDATFDKKLELEKYEFVNNKQMQL